MTDTARRLVVGRLRRPHGLKGDVAVFPLTDDPDRVFVAGRQVEVVDLAGAAVAGPLEIARARAYHREWLIGFRDLTDRKALEGIRGHFLTVPGEELTPPAGEEVYLDELPGFAVQDVEGRPLGLVTAYYELPGGLTLEVQGPRREFLLPYRKEMVRAVDRAGRRLTVELPEGMEE